MHNYFKTILSGDHIHVHSACEKYEKSTVGETRSVQMVLMPQDTDQVQKIIKCAREKKVRIYPLSTGKNWGYSDALPIDENSIILDLSSLTKISNYDAELGSITVEPGVTQKQLATYLKIQGDNHIISVTGSSPDTSIIGNYLERGYGITPYADHADSVLALEAVLANGKLYNSFLNNDEAPYYKDGLGPNCDGLFFQSPLGCVTRMSIKLAPKPESIKLVFSEVKRAQFNEIVLAIQKLRKRWGGHTLTIKLFNAHYPMIMTGIDQRQENSYLNETEQKAFAKKHGYPDWVCLCSVFGTDEISKICAQDVKKHLYPYVKKCSILDQKKLFWLEKIRFLLPHQLRGKIDSLRKNFSYFEGQPSEHALSFAYWLKGFNGEEKKNLNPALDGCGIIWYAPLLPLKKEKISAFLTDVEKCAAQHNFVYIVNLTNYAETYVQCLVPILYCKKTQILQAQKFYKSLLKVGEKRGIKPYRVPDFVMPDVFNEGQNNFVLEEVRMAFDPDYILSNGRYCLKK